MKVSNTHYPTHQPLTFEVETNRVAIVTSAGAQWEVVEHGKAGIEIRCLGPGGKDQIVIKPKCSNEIVLKGVGS